MPQSGFDWKFEIPTWERIYEFLLDLSQEIREAPFHPDIIVGVARGGWPAARVMSDLLENPCVANVKAEFYKGVAETKGEPVITQPVSMPVQGKKVLVVDDVADTGMSLALVKKHVLDKGASEARIATIYYKPWSIIRPDWFVRKTSRWVIFPWERKETVKRILEKGRRQGLSAQQVERILVRHGFARSLIERFVKEASE